MDWLVGGLLPDVAVKMLRVFDGGLLLVVRLIQVDGEVLTYTVGIPLEDLREVLKGAVNGAQQDNG